MSDDTRYPCCDHCYRQHWNHCGQLHEDQCKHTGCPGSQPIKKEG